MSDCVIISGTLEAKLRNKLFAYFHQRYVELVYVENQDDTPSYYEMRLYKNKNKLNSPSYSFIINPISMTCYINYLNSNKHQFTFVCSSQQTSICFSAHTKYERDAWISVLEQLQWQNQAKNIEISRSKSNTTISQSHDTVDYDENHGHENHEIYTNDEKIDNNIDDKQNISYIISLTQPNTNNMNNYYYNYYNSSLYIPENNHKNNQCSCHTCNGQKFTILGLLNDSPCNMQ